MKKIDKTFILEIKNLLNNLSKLLDADRSTLYIYNQEKNNLESIYAQGLKHHTISISVDNSIAGHCFKIDEVIIINNVQKSPLFQNTFDKKFNYKTNSTICLPVHFKSKKFGVLQVLNKYNNLFDEVDQKKIECFNESLSLTILKHYHVNISQLIISKYQQKLLGNFEITIDELSLKKLYKTINFYFNPDAIVVCALQNHDFFIFNSCNLMINKNELKIILTQIQTNPDRNQSFNLLPIKKFIRQSNTLAAKQHLFLPIITNKVFYGLLYMCQIDNIRSQNELKIIKQIIEQFKIDLINKRNIINYQTSHLNFDNIKQQKKFAYLIIDHQLNIVDINDLFKKLSRTSDIIEFLNDSTYDFKYILNQVHKNNQIFYKDILINNKQYTVQFIPNGQLKNPEIAILIYDFSTVLLNQSTQDTLKPTTESQIKTCSILFSDIRNFTLLTKNIGAQKTMALLNVYYEIMSSAVHNNSGIVDNYMGDAFMAVFGLKSSRHMVAFDAISCAIEMMSRLKKLNETLPFNIEIGIGISTGEVIYGRIGAKSNSDLTVIGEAVNLASRLEKSTKIYGEKILTCQNTYQSAKNKFKFREIDFLYSDKTKTNAKIFAVLNKSRWTKKDKIFLTFYHEGIKFYKKKSFQQAKKCFEQALALYPQDKATLYFLDWVNVNTQDI